MYGLTKLPAKSTMQAWATDLASTTSSMMKILGLQAGEDACGTLLGDSSGFSKVKYEDWDDAKRGVVSRRGFNKLHILIVSHGMISVHAVTAGRRHDSPIFRKMYRIIPDGDGYVKLDAAYLARENCDVIAKSGRKPVICPKSNSSVKGFHPMGQMLKWHRDDPDGFNEVYHERSLVETAFSVIKERFGAVARAKKFVMRKLQLVLRCICYNLIA